MFMKKIISLSLLTFSVLSAADVELSPIKVESTIITEVAHKAQTSADLAQGLSEAVPSIDMSRRSGIANDVFIRGQKRDNISVEVDGTKVCGACPNRMDPPVSHILTHQIDSVEVIEGPYDVETFGTLSGGLKITTKKPTTEKEGELNVGFGAFNYKKFGATASGGNEILRVLLTGSMESSDQYKDGDGNNFAEQLKNSAPVGNQLQPRYENMQAYDKKSLMAKAYVTTAENQELRLGYTANRSTNVLYPNTAMDAIRDDSNIYNIEYNIDALSDAYKNLNIQYYYSDVDHPMSTEYRKAAIMNPMMNMTNHMWTTMQGIKLKNSFDLSSYKLLVGLDGSQRTWKGEYSRNTTGMVIGKSIDNALTKNMAIFSTLQKEYGSLDVQLGLRVDSTTVSDDNAAHQDNDYTGIGANLFATYALNKENKFFFGIGQSNRVPDGRELYFQKSGILVGTPNLKQTTNQEADLGYEIENSIVKFKLKAFYSILKDYIYIQKGVATNAFKNIDATVYGAELSTSVYATDALSIDLGASYKRGKKDEALPGQTNINLADMAPLRGNIALNYEYMNNSMATIEVQASDKWSKYDSDNGEQEIGAWSILNMKVKQAINKKFDLTLGVNNLLDATYAQSNTYVDLTLLTTGAGNIMLLNEPGRYVYTNLDFKF